MATGCRLLPGRGAGHRLRRRGREHLQRTRERLLPGEPLGLVGYREMHLDRARGIPHDLDRRTGRIERPARGVDCGEHDASVAAAKEDGRREPRRRHDGLRSIPLRRRPGHALESGRREGPERRIGYRGQGGKRDHQIDDAGDRHHEFQPADRVVAGGLQLQLDQARVAVGGRDRHCQRPGGELRQSLHRGLGDGRLGRLLHLEPHGLAVDGRLEPHRRPQQGPAADRGEHVGGGISAAMVERHFGRPGRNRDRSGQPGGVERDRHAAGANRVALEGGRGHHGQRAGDVQEHGPGSNAGGR